MNINELRLAESPLEGLEALPFWEEGSYRLLWHCDFWDGPMSGMLRRGEERFWFEMVAEDFEKGQWRAYGVVRLTPEELSDEEAWHEFFREHVGTHTDYADRNDGRAIVHPKDRWDAFYDRQKERAPRVYREREPIAWFKRS